MRQGQPGGRRLAGSGLGAPLPLPGLLPRPSLATAETGVGAVTGRLAPGKFHGSAVWARVSSSCGRASSREPICAGSAFWSACRARDAESAERADTSTETDVLSSDSGNVTRAVMPVTGDGSSSTLTSVSRASLPTTK